MDENNRENMPKSVTSENDDETKLASLNNENMTNNETEFEVERETSIEVPENGRDELSLFTVEVLALDNTNAKAACRKEVKGESQDSKPKEEQVGACTLLTKDENFDEEAGTIGSEETFDKVCQTCLEKELQIEAFRYCAECEEYLCEKCVNMHLGVRLTRGHTLLSKEKLDANCRAIRIYKTEQCKIHVNENIEWYCNHDDELCCNVCKAADHANCKSVVTLYSASEKYAVTSNIQKLVRELKESKTGLESVIEKRELDYSALEKDRTDSLQTLKDIKNDTDIKLKCLRNFLESEKEKIERRYSEIYLKMKTEIDNYSRIHKNLDVTASILQNKTICNVFKFIKSTRAEENLKALSVMMKKDTPQRDVTAIRYERDLQFDHKLNTLDRCGYFNDEKCVYKITEREEIDIAAGNKKITIVSAVCVIDKNRLLISDWREEAVKLIDVGKGTLCNKLALTAYPFDVCHIGAEERFALTLTNKRQVKFIKTVNKYIREEKIMPIDTGEKCRGICYCQSKLLVACGGNASENEGPGHIRIFDMEGNLLQTVIADKSGQIMVSIPWKLCVTPRETSAVITDRNKMLLLQISSDCHAIESLTNINTHHGSLCFDNKNRCILANPQFKSIDLLTLDGTYIETLLPAEDLPCRPLSIAMDNSSLRLFVGMENSDVFLSFQLEENQWEKPPGPY